MLALLTAGVALAVAAGQAQDNPIPGSRFVCTALPPEAARAGCPLPAMPMQGGALSPEEELRAAVLQLRETVVQQKETLGAQREAIRELTSKLARCEGLAGGKARGTGATGKDTMGDLPRDPGHVVEQLSRSLQTLKDRLESLELQLHTNASNAGLPSDFREVLQRRLGELERQLLRKVAELEDEKSLLHNETSAHRQKTENTLNALLQRVTELERGRTAAPVCQRWQVAPYLHHLDHSRRHVGSIPGRGEAGHRGEPGTLASHQARGCAHPGAGAEIINIANCSTNMPGNIIPWVDNNVDVFGGASKWPVETCEERLLDL
ncbi:neuronal pentraxin II [Rattus norvegicus]|uniref:Neuronal pentraxin II n=1 Tax=Rattus norvegicus TaxID=10116 RepID=A6K1H1_RAT|nr:neuronal pentraxin II [Rattus norvegicus]